MNDKNFSKILFLTSLLVALFVFVGFGPVLGEENREFLTIIPDKPDINNELSKIDLSQYNYKLDNNKYKFIPEKTIGSYKYTTHEYQTPSGKIGYQTFINDGVNIISTATGPEANERTYTEKINYEKFPKTK